MPVTAARSWSRSKPAEAIAFPDRATWWGGDFQTPRNHLLAGQQPLPSTTVSRLFPTSDGTGDRLMGRLEQPVRPAPGTPLIVLIHGLTGCEDSNYVRRSARLHLMRGRRILRLNLRVAGFARKLEVAAIPESFLPHVGRDLSRRWRRFATRQV
ncbi:MAG: hypothetical protein GC150_17920 [Rhizobiales bacterium]|nr:hypothetical protein [Hyphomicrobiales bacterium]